MATVLERYHILCFEVFKRVRLAEKISLPVGNRAVEFLDTPGPEIIGYGFQSDKTTFKYTFPVGHKSNLTFIFFIKRRYKTKVCKNVEPVADSQYKSIAV